MTELEELEDIVGSLESIEPFGIEPDFSSLGLEPAEVLGFQTEEELENAIKLLTKDMEHTPFLMVDSAVVFASCCTIFQMAPSSYQNYC